MISDARVSSTFSGSPFTRSGRGIDPSVGMNETETLVGSIGFVRGMDPVAARMRPQLPIGFKTSDTGAQVGSAYFASSPNNAVFTSADVDILDATLWASS